MLVLSRRVDQAIVIDGNIRIQVIEIRRDCVRLGIRAPRNITVHREEVQVLVDREQQSRDE